MDIREYLRVARTHAPMFVLLCVSATLTSAGLTYMIPDRYEATALVLVKPQEQIKMSTNKNEKELLSFPVSAGSKVEVPSNTYIEVIKSRAVADKVVRMLSLDRVEVEDDVIPKTGYQRRLAAAKKTVSQWFNAAGQLVTYGRVIGEMPPFEGAVESVRRNLSLKAIKDTYIFAITYVGKDPNKAASIANAAADLFLEYMEELNKPDANRALVFLGSRLQTSERELAQAREAFREFKERHRTISFNEEIASQIKLIADLELDLEKAEVKLAGLSEQLTPAHPKVESVLAERDRLVSTINKRKEIIKQLPDVERQLAALKLRVAVGEEFYQLMKKEYEEARVRAGKEITEIKVVSPAVAPMYPSKPVRGTYVVAAFGMALLIGIGFVLLREYMNTRIRSISDAERVLELRVLATLPQMRVTSRL